MLAFGPGIEDEKQGNRDSYSWIRWMAALDVNLQMMQHLISDTPDIQH